MADFYVDTSALLRYYIAEPGHAWMRSLLAKHDTVIITSQITLIETFSALNRRLRESTLTNADYQDLASEVELAFANTYQVLPLVDDIRIQACQLLERHPLRAFDAVQLATALFSVEALQLRGLPPPTFLCSDQRLLNAAVAEGLSVDNPSSH